MMNMKMGFAILLIALCLLHGGTADQTVDGGWGAWGCWEEECSATCGGGTQTKRRSCDNPAPSVGGEPCFGAAEVTKPCNQQPCPVPGSWGAWQEWFSCSRSCGPGGVRIRVRQCNNPRPLHGGDFCPGGNRQTDHCDNGPCPVDGVWTAWSPYGACSATCGNGQQTKTRECRGPQHGGKTCSGKASISRSCWPPKPRCIVDGQWSGWTDWSVCSVTCGQGSRFRTRACDNPEPESGGKPCRPPARDTEACMGAREHCSVDGGWTDWRVVRPCSSCAGFELRTRRCTNPRPRYGGKVCSGSLNSRVHCCFRG